MRLKVFLPSGSQGELYDLFSYSSQGLPGLEIVGLGTRSRALKEKIIYLTKSLKLKIPLKRYVICLDQELSKIVHDDFFELPILVLYWSMAGILPISELRDCLCSGTINSRGIISLPRLDSMNERLLQENYIVIGAQEQLDQHDEEVRFIDLRELISGFKINVLDLDRERLNHINIAR